MSNEKQDLTPVPAKAPLDLTSFTDYDAEQVELIKNTVC